MSANRILLCMPRLSGNEMKFIEKAFEGHWIVPLGPDVDAFEDELRKMVDTTDNPERKLNKQIVALNSGTSAVHLALIACGVNPGDEVMAQSFTFCASVNPVAYLGAKPVFVDSETETWNMDPELLDRAISDRIRLTGRKPKAIIVVHLYGMPADMNRIMEVSAKYDIPVIEDAAEGFGSKYCGQVCGTFGHFGVLSFNGNKMITTSGGGALIVPDEDAKRNIMFYASQARESYPYYQHEEIGYNYRMSNICACIGRGQMTALQTHLDHHRHVQAMYRELLSDVPEVKLHDNPSPIYDSNFWLCTVTIDENAHIHGEEEAYREVIRGAIGGAGGVTHAAESPHTDCEPNRNVEAMRLFLNKRNIESRPLWKPLHRQPVYSEAIAYTNGVSESLFSKGLCLPAGPWVGDEDVRFIVDSIKEAFKK